MFRCRHGVAGMDAGCTMDWALARGKARVGRGRSLFSRGYVRFGEGQTPGRRIVVDCPFLGCCGRLRRCARQSAVRTAGPIGLCLCRCDLCCEFARPQTAGVLDDSVLPGAGEVNRNWGFANGILMRGCWGGVGVWAVGRVCARDWVVAGERLGGVGGCPFGGWGNPIRL